MANWSHGESNRYVVKTVLDENGNASDLNAGASGDYIYLLQTRDKMDEGDAVGSLLGNGSIGAIIIFSAISVGAASWIFITKKKRHAN